MRGEGGEICCQMGELKREDTTLECLFRRVREIVKEDANFLWIL